MIRERLLRLRREYDQDMITVYVLLIFLKPQTTDAPHASFLHPYAKTTAQPRESIEVRALVFTLQDEG